MGDRTGGLETEGCVTRAAGTGEGDEGPLGRTVNDRVLLQALHEDAEQ